MKPRLIALIAAGIFIVAGCASAVHQADRAREQIHNTTALIVRSTTSTQTHLAAAGEGLATIAQASESAQTHLAAAQQDLAAIAPAAAVIDRRATDAAAITAKITHKLAEERDHWIGYKARVVLWAVALLAVPAVIVFIFQTNGAGPILAVAKDLLAGIFTRLIKPIAKFLFHVVTLGAKPAADAVNRKYDEMQPGANVQVKDLGAPKAQQ